MTGTTDQDPILYYSIEDNVWKPLPPGKEGLILKKHMFTDELEWREPARERYWYPIMTFGKGWL